MPHAKNYAERIAGYFTDEELAVWRFIRDQGGHWSAPELLIHFPAFGDGRLLGGALTRFFNNNRLVRRRFVTEQRKYGVTNTCEPPYGEVLEPTASVDLISKRNQKAAA